MQRDKYIVLATPLQYNIFASFIQTKKDGEDDKLKLKFRLFTHVNLEKEK